MRITELKARITAFCGSEWAASYMKDIVHSELGGCTVEEALAMGQEPAEIWKGVVRHNPQMPPELR